MVEELAETLGKATGVLPERVSANPLLSEALIGIYGPAAKTKAEALMAEIRKATETANRILTLAR